MSQKDPKPVEMLDALRTALHDLNNALTPIMANAQLARLMVTSSEGELGETLDDIVEASGRANALVSEMRQIARDLQEALPAVAESPEGREGRHHG